MPKKLTNTKQRRKPLRCGRLVGRVALALAEQYAAGWKGHAEHIGEPHQHTTARDWASANWQIFRKEARHLLAPNSKAEPQAQQNT